MLTGINSQLLVVLFGVAISVATVRLRYYQIATTLKWLALVLSAYVITAFLVHPRWGAVLRDAFIPSLPGGREGRATLVAILGTTISPYLFFWQASQEVEEEKAREKRLKEIEQARARSEPVAPGTLAVITTPPAGSIRSKPNPMHVSNVSRLRLKLAWPLRRVRQRSVSISCEVNLTIRSSVLRLASQNSKVELSAPSSG